AFVASPEMVAAVAIAGRLDFNPITDTLTNNKGEQVKFDEPTGFELPPKGFDVEDAGFEAPVEDGSSVSVVVSEESERLQLLTPFTPIGNKIDNAKLLIKAFGKCTTDHISMAGPWLRYRGHLDNISNNCLIGAVNAFGKATDKVKNQLTGEFGPVPATARAYKAAGIPSVVVGDHNYGEGSSREHAAMEPRHLGVVAVIVKSFARIHETNLKKQGMLGLTFANEADYDLIQEDDTFNFVDLNEFAPEKQLTLELTHADGSKDTIMLNHTYNQPQIDWYNEGSALNLIKKENASA
ncbi:MAG: aconitate hydratase, partial [Flavobacteriales bacterium]